MIKSIIDQIIEEQVEWVSKNSFRYPVCYAKGFQGFMRRMIQNKKEEENE